MQNMSTIDDLAAALNGRQVTDENGQVTSESAPEEVDSLESESRPLEEVESEPKPIETEPEEAEDDQGRKYVPEKRFREIYGQKKALEREIASLRQAPNKEQKEEAPALDRTNALEMEILFERYPEFNPNDPDKYSEELDTLAGKFVQANPSLSPLQAAREAKEFAKRIGAKHGNIQNEAVMVKRSISDTGIAGRSQKTSNEPDIDLGSASVDDMEKYLKQTGNW